jgi:hypothetical protein
VVTSGTKTPYKPQIYKIIYDNIMNRVNVHTGKKRFKELASKASVLGYGISDFISHIIQNTTMTVETTLVYNTLPCEISVNVTEKAHNFLWNVDARSLLQIHVHCCLLSQVHVVEIDEFERWICGAAKTNTHPLIFAILHAMKGRQLQGGEFLQAICKND